MAMRCIRLMILSAALTACLGASECSESSMGTNGVGTFKAAGAGETPTQDPGQGDPISPMPEPGSAALFGIGALIAAAFTRRERP